MSSRPPFRVLLVQSGSAGDPNAELLRSAALPGELVQCPESELEDRIRGAHALLGCPRHRFSDALLAAAGPQLQWIHVGGAGIEEFLTPGLVQSNITLTNGKILQGPSVADHALALLLALTRNLHGILRGKPPAELPRPIELRGRTAAVVGVGGIGLSIAERAFAFGMEVIGLDSELVPMARCLKEQRRVEDLHSVLPVADVVFVAAPSTTRTRGMFDAQAFDLMKPDAFFVNICRGALVHTPSLVKALDRGRLRGVGLDVTDPEPLPQDHPLRRCDRVILTPHVAGPSDLNRQRSFDLTRENIARFAAGKPLLNVVDKERGY